MYFVNICFYDIIYYKILGDFIMAENKGLRYIKTSSDLNHLYDFEKEALFRDEKYVLAPDFDLDIFSYGPSYKSTDTNAARFYQKLIDNTLKSLNKKQMDEFANRLADSLKNYWNLVYRFGGAEKWNAADFQKRAQYTPYTVIINHAARRGLFSEEGFMFKKAISPDNQVLLNNSGFLGIVDNYDYNFSGQRMEDKQLVIPFIPKQTSYLYGNNKALYEKFIKDFGQKFNFNVAFKGAANPDVLFDLRSGKIHPTVAMPLLSSTDYKYIIPKQDFKDLSISEIYDILSARNVRWEQWQVMSMMDMMVDKVPDVNNGEYLNEILNIVNVNRQLFLKDTNDNYKLWLKIEDKFRNHIDKSKEYIENLRGRIEKLRAEIKANESDIQVINDKLRALNEEKSNFINLERRMSDVSDYGTDYYKRNAKAVQTALNNAFNGKYERLSAPEKPWKIFGWDKEKKQYEELLVLIDLVNNYIDSNKEKRDEIFGRHDFNLTQMHNELRGHINQRNSENYDKETYLLKAKSKVGARQIHDVIQENIDKQKTAKKNRMEKAKTKLKEKGVVFGQKSGVVVADKNAEKIIFDNAVEKMMKKLRATPANAKKSDKELMEIAKRLVSEKQR